MQLLYVFSVSVEVAYTVFHFFRNLQPEVIERKDGTQHILHRGKVKLLMSNVDPVFITVKVQSYQY